MIIDRRALLKSGIAVSTAVSVPGAVIGSQAANEPVIERFVFDTRVPDALAVAQSAAADGIQVSKTDGDLTSLWYDDLNLRWKQQPMTLAGVTGEDALFVLATLAFDFRMRVVQKELLRTGALPVYSWLIAPFDH